MINYDQVPSPCFVLEEELLEKNLEKIDYVQKQAGVKIILALKGFAMFSVFDTVKKYLPGIAASSLNEVLLGEKYFGVEIHTYCPAFIPSEAEEIFKKSTHVTFNSVAQFERYAELAGKHSVSCGLRINPEYSEVKTDLYNPCIPGSRLGVRHQALQNLPQVGNIKIEGLHFHNLCEGNSYGLENTLKSVEEKFGHLLGQIKWINFGGGHLMTHKDYNIEHLLSVLKDFKNRHPHLEVILEPGAAIAWETGVLVSRVLDIIESGGINVAILDVSVAAHMPDCLEMPYLPNIIGATPVSVGEAAHSLPRDGVGAVPYRLGGVSCLAGDWLPEYTFDRPLAVGDPVIFKDMMHYTMVKTTHFNGVHHPSIGIWTKGGQFRPVKEFGFEEYERQLS